MSEKLKENTGEIVSKEYYFKLYLENAEENCCCDCEETHYEGDGYDEPRYKTCFYDGECENCPYIKQWLEDKYDEYVFEEENK